ncbi:hypothetical protein GCM10007304_08270 [Rhodococcoides trifolii]|uniref:HTH marR-type domain-containing protein n=1 Tax=Rhodococcoides trifolii TaxID=908250 RepID=A0A917CRW0_9NOCA|nr:MarR family winged helix-turn-helix transcriptional regulator [Rhodococcus trifolii]GGF96642.1 hypothetical protein GCM10007304_08270 [Rhodococcus trifolii]
MPDKIRDMSRNDQWLTPSEAVVWRAYMGLSLQLTHEMNRQLTEDHGLSLADYSVLVALADSPDGRRQLSELASEIGWERSRLSHHLKRMCARGLAERTSSKTDGRATDAVLTTVGRAALNRAAPDHVSLVQRLFFAGLSDEDVDLLGATLHRLRDHVRAEGTL